MTNLLMQWWRRGRGQRAADNAQRPAVSITDETVWEIRLNRVRTGSITEQAIRRIERDMESDRRLRLQALLWPVGRINWLCGRLVMTWIQVIVGVTAVVVFGACSIWRTETAQWLHELAQMSPAQIARPLEFVETAVLIGIGVATLLYLASHLNAVRNVQRPMQHAWYERIRLAAQIAPLGRLELVSTVVDGLPERKIEMHRLPRGHVTVWV